MRQQMQKKCLNNDDIDDAASKKMIDWAGNPKVKATKSDPKANKLLKHFNTCREDKVGKNKRRI